MKLIITCPNCGRDVWDTSNIDQPLNKCWGCGLRWLNDTDEVKP